MELTSQQKRGEKQFEKYWDPGSFLTFPSSSSSSYLLISPAVEQRAKLPDTFTASYRRSRQERVSPIIVLRF